MPEPTPTNWFKQQREAIGKKQEQIAEELGTAQSTVSGWENGQPPKVKMAQAIADAYGVTARKVIDVIYDMHKSAALASK